MIPVILLVLLTVSNLFAEDEMIKLPPPKLAGDASLEEAISTRRSVRSFTADPLTLEELSQLLWAGQGITSDDGLRAAPSAGALYPVELRIVVKNVTDLKPGLYSYQPQGHLLTSALIYDLEDIPDEDTYRQDWIVEAPVVIFVTAEPEVTASKYGSRANRYIYLEAGHIAQNILLQAVALGLGGTPVGAFEDKRIADYIVTDRKPLYILPIGHPNE